MASRPWALAVIGFVVTLGAASAEEAFDPRYFHHRGGVPEGYASFPDASLQAKSVAAARRVPLLDMHEWLIEHVEHPDGHPNQQVVNVTGLNAELDRRFPLPGRQ